ncbi:conserved hypothetical protein [Leishmania major strain Friedlin]|uniref:Uncharacterized protein n=1 Tax=Leishmania major TaxID=5664 RepID=Q4Q2L0_LEIMA|nr:conserved hypothetical protein [Leishmania major strain Friedlin]CAG9582211.1 hypothetical_protein_-_conserved [Leishmania major strain Friedlin]CAJ08055.1 conserved hypothetical protein [Leishmania major strain Friedlin]|eukprot:XP_001686438.1 conserved hypothetical protein [Leishmania major strain Friedlin]
MQAPDMMLVHTVPIFDNDLRCTHSRDPTRSQMVGKRTADSQCTSPATDAAETGVLMEAAWTGKHSLLPPSTGTVQSTTSSLVEVEQVAWVGLRFLAVKTRQRQLLLVRSGLTESSSSPSSEGDDDAQCAALEGPDGRHRDSSAVCASFARVTDFCTASTAGRRTSARTECSPVSVMIVAGLKRVTGVVCCGGAGQAADPARKAASPQPSQVNRQPLLKEHTWNIGPFNRVAATARDDVQVYICATSLRGSVEVYAWTVHSTGEDAVPVCVHQVLMSPGHFFYGIAVAAAVAPARETAKQAVQDVSFWVMGGEFAVAQDGRTALSCDAEGTNSALPALRGLDGRVIRVNSKSPERAGKNPSSGASHASLAAGNAAPRTLNSLWVAPSNGSAQASDGIAQHTAVSGGADPAVWGAALSELEAVSSLRIEAPCFLPRERRGALKDDGAYVHTRSGCALTRRYALLVHASAKHASSTNEGALSMPASSPRCVDDAQTVAWSSAVMSLDSADGAAALDWLAGAPTEAGTPPPFGLASVAPTLATDGERRGSSTTVVQHMHGLILFTPRRILQFGVSHRREPTGDSITWLGFEVNGTYEVHRPQRIVGLAPLLSPKAPAPLLFFYGSASSIRTNGGGSGEDTRSLYGQQRRKSTWADVVDIQASLLHRLTTWSSPATAKATLLSSSDVQTHLCESELFEKVQAIVQAEGARIQRHLDDRMDRLEAILQRLFRLWE